MANDTPSVVVVVVNWNGKVDTLACLNSLHRMTYTNFQVLVIDNGSTDESISAIRTDHPWVEVIETGINLGYAGGNNVGMKHAVANGADFVLVLNNDTEVAPDLLDRLVEASQQHPAAGILGPRLYYHHDPERIWFAQGIWSNREIYFTWPGQGLKETEFGIEQTETDYVCGAALFFRAEVARRIGYFDERFFLVFEEADWCYRARKAGFETRMVPSARVWHKVGASFGSEASPLRAYFSARNSLLWISSHMPFATRMRFWHRILRRLTPRFSVSSSVSVPYLKRITWAILGYRNNLRRMRQDPLQQAFRQGVRDYLWGRFGDCPQKIRAISRAWTRSRSEETA